MLPTTGLADGEATDNEVGVFGFGNPLRGDDGIVVTLFDRIRSDERDVEATLLEVGSRTGRVVHEIRNFERVLLVDAMDFDGEPGEVLVCSPDDLTAATEATGSHQLNLLELVELAKLLPEAPEEIRLFGIQPGPMERRFGLSDELVTQLSTLEASLLEVIDDLCLQNPSTANSVFDRAWQYPRE